MWAVLATDVYRTAHADIMEVRARIIEVRAS
jgi:hypothetical protein